MTAEQIATIERLLADGASCSDAAATVGVSPTTVYRRWREHAWSRQQVCEHAAAVRRFNQRSA